MNFKKLSAVYRLLALGLTLTVVGCGYGEVSPAAYQYAKAIYSAASRRATEHLDTVEASLDEALASGELSPQEAGWLRGMIEDARQGEWEAAQKRARRLMEDQVKAGGNAHTPLCCVPG